MRAYIVALLLVVSHGGVHAELFKWKDADGNLIYSDQPPPGQPKEETRVDEEALPEIIPVPAVEATTSSKRRNTDSSKSSLLNSYQDFSITQPVHDTSVRENSGKVHISIRVEPNIFVERGHKLVIYMDGVEVYRGEQTSITLDNIDRGTHTLKASIVSRQGQSIQETGITTFTLHRYHI